MYLVEYKLGDYKIKTYVLDDEALGRFVRENPQYEYVKVICDTTEKIKVRRHERKKRNN